MWEPAPDVPLPSVPPRIHPRDRLGAAIEVVICSGFPTQLVVLVILQGFGMRLLTADGRLSPPFIFTLALSDSLLIVALVVLFLRAHHESIQEVLLGRRSTPGEIVRGLLLLPGLFVLALVVLAVLFVVAPGLHNVARNPLEDMLQSRTDALVFAGVVMVAGGLREEMQRAFVLHRFRGYLGGVWWGLAIHSVIFGLGHYEQGYDAMIVTGLLGVIWGVVFIVRGSIVAPMVSHAGFNLTQLLKYFAFGS